MMLWIVVPFSFMRIRRILGHEKPFFPNLGIVSCEPPKLTGDGIYTVNAVCYPGCEKDVTEYLLDSLLGNKMFDHPCWIKVDSMK
jgi:hypothetical protein